jgi:hypothetical protein
MNRELPKSIREALARQTPGDAHPSVDALAAFAEHGLTPREQQSVTEHLARCAECREVVFLASSTVEAPVGEEQEWMAADAVPRISPALRAKSEAAVPETPPVHAHPWRKWTLRWALIPAVAVVLLVSGVLVLRRSELNRSAPLNVANNVAAPVVTVSPQTAPAPGKKPQPQVAPKSNAALELRKPASPEAKRSSAANTLAAVKSASATPDEHASGPAPATISKPSNSDMEQALRNALQSAPGGLPTQNSFAQSESQGASAFVAKPPQVVGGAPSGIQGFRTTHPQWRISPDGHLERLNAPGSWTRVLTDEPDTFRVVSVVHGNVWAGGAGGALFHSHDGGQNWSKVTLGTAPNTENDTIVSIQFSDAQNGVVTTAKGTHWTTSDGGATWGRE